MSARQILTGALALTALATPIAALADVVRGEALFRPCRACHMIGEGAVHRVGPDLNGLVGRRIGSAAGYEYSDDLTEAGAEGEIWTDETLDRFLAGPRAYFPGTNMVFRGITASEDRAALIAYLSAEGGAPDGAAQTGGTDIDPEIATILEIEGDIAYGAYLSSECTACHRAAGGTDIPSIAGLAPSVFIAGLLSYRNGTRQHLVMNALAQRLGDEEIAALAAYFASAE